MRTGVRRRWWSLAARGAPIGSGSPGKTSKTRFQKIRGAATADKEQIARWLDKIPPAIRRNPALWEKLFRHGEGDPHVTLSPSEKQVFYQYINSTRQENRELFNRLERAAVHQEYPENAWDPQVAAPSNVDVGSAPGTSACH